MRSSLGVPYILRTERLGLRRWSPGDLEPFARMNQDSKVMRYFPQALTRGQTEDFIAEIERHFEQHRYGLYAVDEMPSSEFVGFVGLYTATFEAEFTPCPEIGWRLDTPHWGKGYATEAARACLRQGFREFGIDEIFSFTSAINGSSVAVMERIGLRYRKSFLHPRIEKGSELCSHVLYALTRTEYSYVLAG
jgi:RimJ/RimL family protein N-acetyltransferase